ncbi:MAG: PadR family transcriptional regulator [Actinomycetota bacterium]|nr:PadR family transcriptional regulator [Actinomycetota bacterium]
MLEEHGEHGEHSEHGEHGQLADRVLKLNATAASVLGLLHRGPMTGWDVARLAEVGLGDFWNVTQSQVYRELRNLQLLGLVEAGPAGARDKKPYTITVKGRVAFEEWMRREPGADLIRSPLLLMVFFGRHLDPVNRRRFLAIQRLRHEQRLDEYGRILARLGDDEPDLAKVLQFAVFHEEAVLRWFAWLHQEESGAQAQ